MTVLYVDRRRRSPSGCSSTCSSRCSSRSASDDRERVLPARPLPRRPDSRSRSRSAPTWRASTRASRRSLDRRARARSSGSSTALCGVDPERGHDVEDVRGRDAALQRRSACSSSTCCSACRACCRSTRRACGAVTPDSSFNTAVSFATNTNWQGYGGETTMSYLTQMLGARRCRTSSRRRPAWRSLVALIRGFARSARRARSATSGSISTRSTLYILLPLSLVLALVLVSQGVVQTLRAVPRRCRCSSRRQDADGKRGRPSRSSPSGPAASQIAIKQLGTNGGGFFNVNSAHPFENPTPLSNFLECSSILLIPAALCYTFGEMVGDTRQGWAVLAAMTVIFVAAARALRLAPSSAGNPALAGARRRSGRRARSQPGGNMEGKEVRFGIANSALWATATTAASNGSVNSMHDSLHAARRPRADVADAARRGRSSAASAPGSTACSSSRSSPCSSPG